MGRRRTIGFLLFFGVAAAVLYAWPTAQLAPAATVHVTVEGPEGGIWNGTVTADPGNAFQALVAAAEAGNFTIHWTGQGSMLYVDEVAGYDDSNGGWCVQTDDGSGSGWQDSPSSPAVRPVADGWGVRWYWTDDQCDVN